MVISYISETLGFPEGKFMVSSSDQLRYFICVFLTYPLSYVNYMITDPTLRLWYGLVPGLMLQYMMYGTGKLLLSKQCYIWL